LDPKWVRVIAIVVVVGLVASGVGVYYYLTNKSKSCSLSSTNPLIFDQPEKPDSLDPGQVYTTPGWGIAQQVYQTLVMYNQSSVTTYNGLLAKNWSESTDGLHWNFTMWPGEHFSNGDPLNAYVMWWSLYRNLIIDQPIVFLLEENFYVPNVNYYSPLSQIEASNNSLIATLQNFTTTAAVTQPPSALLSAMTATNQSFQVINNLTIEFNLGFGYLPSAPYTYLLDQLATPPFAAVDPLAILANGGVQYGSLSTWMNSNMLGSGPFVLSAYDPSTGYTLAPSPNYWATSIAAAEPLNNIIQPAQRSIEIVFQENQQIDVENLKSGEAAVASFAYIGPTTLSQIQGNSCISVQALSPVYGALSNSWWIYMDQNVEPFNNLSVRAAIIHATDYNALISSAYGGNAVPWAGPVPPGYPDYPTNITPYQHNQTLACQEIAQSPWPYDCATGAGGYTKMTGHTLNFEYVNVGTDSYQAAVYIQGYLATIGISVNLVGLDLNQLAAIQAIDPTTGNCVSTESTFGGPFYIGENYYTGDYVSPDDAAQLNALSYGGYNICMSQYANGTVDNLIYEALSTSNATLAGQLYWQMSQIMYQNYTDAWLYVPTAFAVSSSLLKGVVLNPMGSGLPFTLVMNTEHT
jgi:peptide/nickel transport system substrate-binding protein